MGEGQPALPTAPPASRAHLPLTTPPSPAWRRRVPRKPRALCHPHPRQQPARGQNPQRRLPLGRCSPVLGPDAQQVTPSVRPRGPGRALGLLRPVHEARSPPVEAREGPVGRAHGRRAAALPRGRRCPPCHSQPPFIDSPHMPLSIVTQSHCPASRAACPASSSCSHSSCPRYQLEFSF